MTELFKDEVTFSVILKKEAPKDFPNLVNPTKIEFKASSIVEGQVELSRLLKILKA